MVSDGAAIWFNRRVKSHPNIYSSYRRLLTSFARGKLDVQTTASELQTLFKGHNDLLYGCPMFLPTRQLKNKHVVPDMDMLKSSINFQNKLENRFPDNQGVICEYLKIIKALTKSELSNNEAYDKVANIFGDENQDLVDEFGSILKIKKRKKEEENVSEEIKAKRQKTAEERIIYMRIEDDMCDVDTLLTRVRTILQSANALMKYLEDSTQQQHHIINIVDHFLGDVRSRSCIIEEYKEQSRFITKRLREDPKHVLPQFLSKLKSKEKELIESKEKLLKRWHEARQQKQNSMLIASRKE